MLIVDAQVCRYLDGVFMLKIITLKSMEMLVISSLWNSAQLQSTYLEHCTWMLWGLTLRPIAAPYSHQLVRLISNSICAEDGLKQYQRCNCTSTILSIRQTLFYIKICRFASKH